ncbi:MAG: hydroxymethylglutaryl-CoA synthase [Woeseiaceae bacterium]|nr:hydroxymethylglutaryl-CoA synthase [Woeseiaceae bacterium]
MRKLNTPIGISGIAAYIPPYRVWLNDWCEWTNNQWPKIREVVGRSFRLRGNQHSVYTMAATAVIRLIDQYNIDPTKVKFLALGTESSNDNSAGAIIIKGMINEALISQNKPPISRSCEVPEFKHACLGGVYAMKGAIRQIALDGNGGQAIVVCADIAEYPLGSSGEPTQGAGAVAMLVEENPKLLEADILNSGSASDYRILDFRKPMIRFCHQDRNMNQQVQDFPIFNGKYSTTCYLDETLHALNDMYQKRNLDPIKYLRTLNIVFMHRPYRKMPETGLAIAYLFALAKGGSDDQAELASYCYEAGIEPQRVIDEIKGVIPDIKNFANPDDLNNEAYPMTMAVFRIFRASRHYRREILDKMALGSDTMLDLGNLYTAALPAWIAAGMEQALTEDINLDNQEILTFGYGSGDAAEVIPFKVCKGWKTAAAKIKFAEAMAFTLDINKKQYLNLHAGKAISGLDYKLNNEFTIDYVGNTAKNNYQDMGIEYHKYTK